MKKEVLEEKAVLIVGKLLKKEVDRKISKEIIRRCIDD
jgi:hypothetical protein